MLLITSYKLKMKKYYKCKGRIRVIGLVTLHSSGISTEVTLKICSELLLLQLRAREF